MYFICFKPGPPFQTIVNYVITDVQRKINGVLGHNSALYGLYCAGDNLG